MTVAESTLCLREISLENENLVENDVCSRLNGKPGLVLNKGPWATLLPSTFLPKQQFASHCLTSAEFLALLERVQLCLLTEVDCDSHLIPKVAQRVPTKDRKEAILAAWRDSTRTSQNKVETLEISLFNADITPSQGIILTDDVLLVLEDGAGRVFAAMEELESIREAKGDIKSHVLIERDIVIQLNLDLSGDPINGMKAFLAYNRDAKRITKGTTLAVENGLLSLLGDDIELSFDNQLSRTWVVNRLYEDYPVHGSIVEFLPWQIEGRKTTSNSFDGRGNAASILTTLKDLDSDLKKSGLTVEELPAAIDFAFRCWYELCPQARSDSRGANRYHFTSTLALKVMLVLGVRIFAFGGDHKKKFNEIVRDVITRHFKHHKDSEYLKKTTKKMDPDKFWQESKHFADPSTFNSGAANTQKIISQLRVCLEDSLDARS